MQLQRNAYLINTDENNFKDFVFLTIYVANIETGAHKECIYYKSCKTTSS